MTDTPGATPEGPQHPEVAEAVDATLPATPKMKQDLLDLIDTKLKTGIPIRTSKEKSDEIREELIVKETNTPPIFITLRRWESSVSNPNNILAIAEIKELTDTMFSGPTVITNYHFKEGPDELSVEKLLYHDEPPIIPSRPTSLEELQQMIKQWMEHDLEEAPKRLQAITEERAIGLTFFSQQDAKDLTDLLTKAVPRK